MLWTIEAKLPACPFATQGLISLLHQIGRENGLWSGAQWWPAENVAQRANVGHTVLAAGQVARRIDEQMCQFRLRLNGEPFQ